MFKPGLGFIRLIHVFHRNIIGHVSARGESESGGASRGQTDDRILPRRQQAQTQSQRQLQVSTEAHSVFQGHIPDPEEVQLFIDGEAMGADFTDFFHDPGAVTADKERGGLIGVMNRFDGRLAVGGYEFPKGLRFDLGGHRIDDGDDVATHLGIKIWQRPPRLHRKT